MNCRIGLALLALGIIPLLTGCASYEYDIVQPADVAQHVGSKVDVVFDRAPLIYRMRTYDNHLVVQIHNPTTQPVTLLGAQSYVVDPHGQSHPVRTQTMGPDAFVKLILPPLPPEVVAPGPAVGFDFGLGPDYPGPGYFDPIDDPFWYPPRYFVAVTPAAAQWTWDGEGDVRLGLIFQPWQGPLFRQEFVLHRRKM